MKIGEFNTLKDVFIIAEIGNNHEGDVKVAEKLIYQAAKSGANAVKFQTIIPEKLVSVKQKERIKQLKKFEITNQDYIRLKKVAENNGLIFLSTPFSVESVDFLDTLVPAFKISSSDNNYLQLIERVANKNKPIILSTGMSEINQILETTKFIKKLWVNKKKNPGLALLHCVSSYPTPEKFANLKAINTLSKLGYVVGYSDHTIGIEAAVLSVGLGARIIEKHFTLSNNYSEFRDHKISAEPKELEELVNRVKQANILLGDEKKEILSLEKKTMKLSRRSVCAAYDLKAGRKLKNEDLICLRPAGGVEPKFEKKILGRKLLKNIKAGNKIITDFLE